MNPTSSTDRTLERTIRLVEALCQSNAYKHDVKSIKLVQTHISWLLLTGHYAYKIKKPVNFGFLDFSTLEKRRFCCNEEIRLNQRLSKDIYLEVVAITGSPQTPKFGGDGEAIEYAVKMKQFPDECLLSDFAVRHELGTAEIDQLARVIADFHKMVERADIESPYGNCQDIKHWFDENFAQIKPLLKAKPALQQLQLLEAWGEAEWADKAGLMQRRKQQGKVRECHGDLHLGNITLIGGQSVPFDCIEFNPLLRWIDVISEIAFLVMDLLHHGYEEGAYRLLNRYLQLTGDYRGLGLLRYYLVYRAMVRAKVSILRMQQCQGESHATAQADFVAFMGLAERFTRAQPALFIMHGLSGSGKSTVAEQLAQNINAIQIRSDIERKRLYGYDLQDSTGSGIDSGLYSEEATQKTYSHLADLAKDVIAAGFSVIIDAAFLKTRQRELFRQAAIECGKPFIIIDVVATEAELVRRIQGRKDDASEATVEILEQQHATEEPLAGREIADVVRIDTEGNDVLGDMLKRLGKIYRPEKTKP